MVCSYFREAFSILHPLERYILSKAFQRHQYQRKWSLVRRLMDDLSFALLEFSLEEIFSWYALISVKPFLFSIL